MTNASARNNVLFALAAFFTLTVLLHGRAPGTGAITGMVRDPSGLAVVNAAVSAVNGSTDEARSSTTN